MKRLLPRPTPMHFERTAKVVAMGMAMLMTAGYVNNTLTVEQAGIAAYVLATSLLMAMPSQRSSELLGAAAIWMTTAEFMSAAQSGHFSLWRWAVAVATLALVIVPIKIQYVRGLARENAHRPIADSDRRAWTAGATAPSTSQLAALRGEAPAT